jgi:hypothetical protein
MTVTRAVASENRAAWTACDQQKSRIKKTRLNLIGSAR